MTEINKPDLTHIWANSGDVRAPSALKIDEGWTSEIPPFQWENYAQNRQDQGLVHIFQKGISLWSSTEQYYKTVGSGRSYVQGSDGIIYGSKQASTGQDPVTDTSETYWQKVIYPVNSDFAVSSGIANAYVVTYSPKALLAHGTVLKFSVVATNTGASTLAVDGTSPLAIVGLGLFPLQGGELFLGGVATVVRSTAAGGWVLLSCTGGNIQTKDAVASHHATTLQQVQTLLNTAIPTTPFLYYIGQI